MDKNNFKYKLLIQSLLIHFLLGNILIVSSMLIDKWVRNLIFQKLVYVLSQLIIAFFVFAYTKKTYNLKHDNTKYITIKGLFKYGIIIWIYILGLLIFNYVTPEKDLIEALPNIFVNLIIMIGVGFYEEMLFRVLLVNTFKNFFTKNRKGIILSLSLSSIIFGLAHLPNLINYNGAIVLIFSQVIYAMIIGFMFAVLYHRTNNIIICIIFHTLIDFAGSFWSCFINATHSLNDIPMIIGLIYILLFLPMLIVAILQLRRNNS